MAVGERQDLRVQPVTTRVDPLPFTSVTWVISTVNRMKTQERQEDRGVREVGHGQPRSSVARDCPAFVYVVERTGKVSWGSQQDQLHGHATSAVTQGPVDPCTWLHALFSCS